MKKVPGRGGGALSMYLKRFRKNSFCDQLESLDIRSSVCQWLLCIFYWPVNIDLNPRSVPSLVSLPNPEKMIKINNIAINKSFNKSSKAIYQPMTKLNG